MGSDSGAQLEASKLTDKASKSKEYDGVKFENIADPYISNNYGVFEPEQVYMLGSKEDQKLFGEFIGNTSFLRIDPFLGTQGIPMVDINLDALKGGRAKEIAEVIANKLSLSLNVNYENITAERAMELLESRPVPYRGEPAFYFAGTVYTVGENVNMNTVLHEFSHPLLQGLRRDNIKLFRNLYSQLMATEEGVGIKEHVLKNYPELKEDSDLFKEEALAFALQLKAFNKVLDQVETKGYESFIKKLLSAIRKMLRGIFGSKVKVSKLNESTTLDEMAGMLLDKDFDFSTPNITEEDLVMYARMVAERASDLVKHSSTESLQKILEQAYNANLDIIRNARKFKSDKSTKKMVKEALFEKGTTQFLTGIRSSLADYMDFEQIKDQTEDEKVLEALDAEERRVADLKNKSVALVNSFDTMNSISKNMLKDLSKISNDPSINSRHIIGMMILYKNTSRAWMTLLKDIDEILKENGQHPDSNNEFFSTLNELANNITRIQTSISDILKNNNVQFFVEITGYMNEFVNDRLNSNLGVALKNAYKDEEELEQAVLDVSAKVTDQTFGEEDVNALVKKGVPKHILEGFVKEYKEYIVNPEKIRGALTGNAHDVSWFNRWLESYSSSNDIIVGPLSIFIQNERTEIENEVWKKSLQFRKKLKELLPKVGFSKLNVSQMRDMLGEKDTIMFFDKETGEPLAKEVYTFVQEFGNGWRFQQDMLEYDVAKAKEEGNLDAIAEAQQKLQEFNNDFMWQEFVPEYYERNNIFKESPVGKLALALRKEKLAAYNNLQNQFDNELDRVENYPAIKAAWREYQQLSSLSYEDGTLKSDDPEKGIFDKSIAELFIKAKEEGTQWREMVPVAGSLQIAYNEFVNLLESNGITKGSAEFMEKMQDWQKQNLKIKYTDEYWRSRNKIIDEVQEIQSKIKNRTFDVAEAYKIINNYIFSYRDEFNQPIANEMGDVRLRKIKDLQQQIIDYRSEFDSSTGLTKEQAQELRKLSRNARQGLISPGSAQSERYLYLISLQEDIGITSEESARLTELFDELSDISLVMATDYYMDALNYNLSKQNLKEIQESEVRDFINSDDFQEILENSESFKEWFELNHVEQEVWDKELKATKIIYILTKANTVTIPSDPSHFESTEIEDTSTGDKVVLPGVPSARHSRFEVKDEYRTIPFGEDREKYVGKYVDNKGNFLPRKYDPSAKYSAKDDRFMSQKYIQMKAANNAQFELLEAMKEYHLQMQEGQSNYAKLYLDMPRYAIKKLDIYQRMQMGKYGERFKNIKAGVGNFLKQQFGRSKVDYENDLNYNPEYNLVNTDLNGEAVSYIPVTGIYNLDLDITDADILSGMFKYALSIQTQTKLLESLPLVESVLSTLEDPENKPKDLEKYSKGMFNVRGILQRATKKGAANNRLGQVKSLIEREYYGKQVKGIDETHPMVGKIMASLQGLSAFGSLAFNIGADLKNQYSGYVQTILETTGQDFITTKDLALAVPWATKAMLDWTRKGIYEIGPGSMSTQLIQIFDPAFKATDEFGREVMRSLVKDLTNMEWMFMHRKFGEMDVAVKLFGAFLHGQKITQVLDDGTEKTLRYVNAWEKDEDGIIKLKKGIHPGWNNTPVYHEYKSGETFEEIAKEYNISVIELKAKNRIKSEIQLEDGQEIVIAKSEKFKALKNRLQGTSRRLFGVYDRMGSPEGNKLLLYRLFFFMRKWFTPMFANRFGMDTRTAELTRGGERYDWALGKYTKGYYITAFQVFVKMLKSKGTDYQHLTDQEKGDFRRFASEGLATIMLAILASMLLGYDPDDEDRWNKMKARSGAINEQNFNTYGFLSNHMLLLILGVQAETTAFVPLPKVGGVNLGADDYVKMVTSTSSAWYNTTTLYVQMLSDILSFITFNGLPEYKKDIGPYWWQEKGTPKIYKKMFKAIGFTGGTGDPVTLTKNLEGSSSRYN